MRMDLFARLYCRTSRFSYVAACGCSRCLLLILSSEKYFIDACSLQNLVIRLTHDDDIFLFNLIISFGWNIQPVKINKNMHFYAFYDGMSSFIDGKFGVGPLFVG